MPPALARGALLRQRERQAVVRELAGTAWQDRDGLVFTDPVGRAWHPATMTTMYAALVRRAGVGRLRLHDLRHTAATLALAAGLPVRDVSDSLGHATPSITLDIYGQTVAEGAAACRRRDGPGALVTGDGSADLEELHAWYASILARLGELAAGEIIASWRRSFRPTVSQLTRPPTRAEVEAQPDCFVQDDRGKWYGVLADAEEAELPADGPSGESSSGWMLFPARGGVAIRTADGHIVQDREAALRAGLLDAGRPPWVLQMVDALLASGRRLGVSPKTRRPWRRGVERPNLARALLVESLSLRIGKRPAARQAIRWEAELDGALADADAAAAVERFDRGELRSDAPKLEAAMQTVLRDVERVLGVIGERPVPKMPTPKVPTE